MCYSEYCSECHVRIASCEEDVVRINDKLHHISHYPILNKIGIDNTEIKKMKEIFGRPPSLNEAFNFVLMLKQKNKVCREHSDQLSELFFSFIAGELGIHLNISKCIIWSENLTLIPLFHEAVIDEQKLKRLHINSRCDFLISIWPRFFYGFKPYN